MEGGCDYVRLTASLATVIAEFGGSFCGVDGERSFRWCRRFVVDMEKLLWKSDWTALILIVSLVIE